MQHQIPDATVCAHFTGPAGQQIDEPASSTDRRGHADVEGPHLEALLVQHHQIGHRANGRRTQRAGQGHRSKQDDAGEGEGDAPADIALLGGRTQHTQHAQHDQGDHVVVLGGAEVAQRVGSPGQKSQGERQEQNRCDVGGYGKGRDAHGL